jgi:hypothetical protein
MSRRYQEMEEKAARARDAAKVALKALRDRERAHLMMWLLKYFEDSGAMRSPQAGKPRRIIVIDGTEYWLAVVPKRRNR